MGLSVSVYSGLTLIEDEEVIKEVVDDNKKWVKCDYEGNYVFHNVDDVFYYRRSAPIEKGKLYKHDGDYEHVYSSSYSGYNTWREILAKMADYPLVEYSLEMATKKTKSHAASAWGYGDHDMSDMPFYEMIDFTDCDGTLGTVSCIKLYEDFKENYVKAKAFSVKNDAEWWFKGYEEFLKGFAFAAKNNGFIEYG